MPITLGFWAHINDLLGTGKQGPMIDGQWANSLKTFIKGALPFQKCLVKQVGITVFLNPDILDSYRLPFYLTYTRRARAEQRGAPCKAGGHPEVRGGLWQRRGPVLWRSIYFMIHKGEASGADDSVHLWKVPSSFDLYSRRKEKK